MGFYFKTFRQEQGDKAYNEQKYEEALKYYSEALKTLNLHAASNSARHADFYDALVYVLSEIITTRLMLIRNEIQNLNFDAVTNYWQDIPSFLYEMELTHKEHLTGLTHTFSNKDQVMKRTPELLATVCEEVSDELIDQLEEGEETNLLSQKRLVQAIEWMNRAITFQLKTKDSPKLSSSLGYLNLLERHYKETGDQNTLQVMSEYIGKHKLLEATIKSPLRKLELLSYVARLALFYNQDISGLTSECKTLYSLLDEEEKENPILDDLQNLLNLIPHHDEEDGTEERPFEMMDQTDNSDSTWDLEENLDHLATIALAADSNTNNTDVSSMDIQWTSDQLMEQNTLMNQSLSTQGFGRTPQSFFSIRSSSTQSVFDELPHSRALQYGLEKITINSSNPKFLANLLSLIADFFDKYRASGIQKQNAIVLAFDLYQHVLKIDPQHLRASVKLKELRSQHHQLIGAYKFFSTESPSFISDTTQISAAKSCFNQAIEELTIQLESFLMHDHRNMEKTINDLINFIGEQLTRITTPSHEIRALLTQAFQEELQNSAHPRGGNLSL